MRACSDLRCMRCGVHCSHNIRYTHACDRATLALKQGALEKYIYIYIVVVYFCTSSAALVAKGLQTRGHSLRTSASKKCDSFVVVALLLRCSFCVMQCREHPPCTRFTCARALALARPWGNTAGACILLCTFFCFFFGWSLSLCCVAV